MENEELCFKTKVLLSSCMEPTGFRLCGVNTHSPGLTNTAASLANN